MNDYFLAAKKVELELKKILADKTSGSTDLLLKLNKLLQNNFSSLENPTQLLHNLKIRFKSFQNIQKYLRELSSVIAHDKSPIIFFESFRQNNRTLYDRIFDNAFSLLKNKSIILTLSNSMTVFEILKRLHSVDDRLKIIVSESRPKLEGRLLAKRLAKEKINVHVITEAMMAKYIPSCDCAVVGADTIFPNGDAVNKVGSQQVAILCKHFDKPFYVVADKSKLSSKRKAAQNAEDKNEIWENPPHNIKVQNFYFEIVPAGLITKCITE